MAQAIFLHKKLIILKQYQQSFLCTAHVVSTLTDILETAVPKCMTLWGWAGDITAISLGSRPFTIFNSLLLLRCSFCFSVREKEKEREKGRERAHCRAVCNQIGANVCLYLDQNRHCSLCTRWSLALSLYLFFFLYLCLSISLYHFCSVSLCLLCVYRSLSLVLLCTFSCTLLSLNHLGPSTSYPSFTYTLPWRVPLIEST